MRTTIPYGDGYLELGTIDFEFNFIEPKYPKKKVNLEWEILRSLKNPIKMGLEGFKGCDSLTLVTGDDTRPVPYKEIVSLLTSQLRELGLNEDRITLIVGGGLHPPIGVPRAKTMLGDLYDRVKVVLHDSRKSKVLKFLGKTRLNTPVWINKNYFSEKRIVVGMIDPHQFVGFTGGAKGVGIGIAGYETIEANHSLMTHKNAKLGVIKNNPARKDIDEIGKIAKIDFILNVVLNRDRKVIRAFAGDWFLAHRKGVNYLRNLVKVKVPYKTKITIVAPGGYPRDINVYQAQKALSPAEMVTEEGGVIILVAKCPEGLGDDVFEKTLKKFETPVEIVDYFKNTKFKMGVHKAYLWARTLIRHRVILVSDAIDKKYSEVLKVDIIDNLGEAIKIAKESQDTGKINVMPYGNFTVPYLEEF